MPKSYAPGTSVLVIYTYDGDGVAQRFPAIVMPTPDDDTGREVLVRSTAIPGTPDYGVRDEWTGMVLVPPHGQTERVTTDLLTDVGSEAPRASFG